MSIDLLPFNAFALESCAAPAPAPHDAQTLTLPLRVERAPGESIAGQLSWNPAGEPEACVVQRAAIVPPPQSTPLTITFGCSSDAQ
jgi:hypothetical protein